VRGSLHPKLALVLGTSFAVALGCATLAGVEDGQLVETGGTAGTSSGGSGASGGSAGSGGTTTTGGGGAAGSAGGASGSAGAPSGGGGTPSGGGGTTSGGGGSGGSGGSATDPYAAAVLADQPLAYFRFAETTGAVAKNEVSGSAFTATYPVSGATRGAAGIRAGNAAIHFDDVNATLPVLGAMDFPGDAPFTIEFWIQIDNLTTSGRFFEQMTTAGNKSGTWLGLWKSSANEVRSETWSAGTHIFYTLSASAPPQSQFLHIVLLHRATEWDHLYVNGAEGTGMRLAAGDRVAVSNPFQFVGFVGTLDEFAVYDKALTTTQIASHLAAQAQ